MRGCEGVAMFLEHILKIGEKVVREVAAMWGRRVALTLSRTETFFGSTENRWGLGGEMAVGRAVR